jgi:hypothetical protein
MTQADTDPQLQRLVCGSLWLSVRRGVSVREFPVGSAVLFYLSLFDDEIDQRAGRLIAGLGDAPPDELDPTRVELTDAVIIRSRSGRLTVIRGGACTVPCYWSRDADVLHITTALPVRGGAALSRAGLVTATVTCGSGSYEPNAWLDTPLAGWTRLRRGMRTTFTGGSVRQDPIEFPLRASPGAADRQAVSEAVRGAFEAFGRAQPTATAVLELSGGFDSTLAGAAAARAGASLHGVSVEFPYYEFRFEPGVQQATASHLGIGRTVLDGTTLFPYSPLAHPALFDEPTVFVTGMRHAETVASVAAWLHASRIYMGHGGDQLFSTNLAEPEATAAPPSRGPYSRRAWQQVRRAVELGHSDAWRRRTTACFVYDARQDIVMKERWGLTIRTPFTDLAVWHAALRWTAWNAARGSKPDKTILAAALPGWLPAEVTGRRGKVAYDGVWLRAYARHADHIGATFERAAGLLSEVGVSPGWLIRRVEQLAAWKDISDREVLGAYALASWLLAWEFERPADASWS